MIMKTLIDKKKQTKLKVFIRQETTNSRIVSIKLLQKDTTNKV